MLRASLFCAFQSAAFALGVPLTDMHWQAVSLIQFPYKLTAVPGPLVLPFYCVPSQGSRLTLKSGRSGAADLLYL